jgi:hypothetical protein
MNSAWRRVDATLPSSRFASWRFSSFQKCSRTVGPLQAPILLVELEQVTPDPSFQGQQSLRRRKGRLASRLVKRLTGSVFQCAVVKNYASSHNRQDAMNAWKGIRWNRKEVVRRNRNIGEFAYGERPLFLFSKFGICGTARICLDCLSPCDGLSRIARVDAREHNVQVGIHRAARPSNQGD